MNKALTFKLLVTQLLLAPALIFAQAPVITSFKPLPNATRVLQGANVELKFSKQMSPQTASPAGITVRGSQTGVRTIAGGGTFSGGGTKAITFDPAQNFLAGEEVWVSVGGQAKSLQGDFLFKPQVYNFLAKTKPALGQFTHGFQLPFMYSCLGAADFDGDGDVDLVSQDYQLVNPDLFSYKIFILLRKNDGQGNFTESDTLITGLDYEEYLPFVGDLEGDGDIDITLQYNPITLLNNGSGVFQSVPAVAAGSVDVDGDGDLDFITTRSDSSSHNVVQVALNDGQGNAGAITDEITLPAGNRLGNAIDLDGDNDVDFELIWTSGGSPQAIYTLKNDGRGHYSLLLMSVSTGAYVYDAGQFNSTGDLDGDGDLDRVTQAHRFDTGYVIAMFVRLNDGNGNFTNVQQFFELDGSSWLQFNNRLADLDGDGDLDLVIQVFPSDTPIYFELWLNDGSGHFTKEQTIFPNGSLVYNPFYVADFDGDGDVDIATNEDILLKADAPLVCQADGGILREFWANVPGHNIQDIPLNTPPTFTDQLTSFRTRAGVADYYGQRIRGYICAPVTGNYTFFIEGDDKAELWLSTDSNSTNKQLIAWAKVAWGWTESSTQQSASISLVAGQRYYVEVLHKEGVGGDVVRVGWRTPGMTAGSEPIIIPGSVLSPVRPASLREVTMTSELPTPALTASPNPFSGRTSVTFTSQQEAPTHLVLYDVRGMTIKTLFQGMLPVGGTKQVDVESVGLTAGMYFLRLINGQYVTYLKVIVAP